MIFLFGQAIIQELHDDLRHLILNNEPEDVYKIPRQYQTDFKVMLDILNELTSPSSEYALALGFFNSPGQSPAYVKKNFDNLYQIAVSSELLSSKFTLEEKYAVLAHEMGHVVGKHFNQLYSLLSFSYELGRLVIYCNILFLFYEIATQKINLMVLLGLHIVQLILLFKLVQQCSQYFKKIEYEADLIAIEHFKASPQAFGRTLLKLEQMMYEQYTKNHAGAFFKYRCPIKLKFSTHPSIEERICHVLNNSV
jgi:Zn-dependent protease with chaperone function